MAQDPYNPVASVEPNAAPPDDFQHIQATPASFGGDIATGVQKAGAGAVDLSKFWGKVQSQDASNNAEKEASDLLTQTKMLQGQDALDAQPKVLASLDAIRQKYRDQLTSPESQSQYDGTTTPFFNRFIRGSLDTHFVDQGKTVASKINNDSYSNALNMATAAGSGGSSDPNDKTFWMKDVEVARAKAFMSIKTDAVQKGLWGSPEAQAAAEQKANLIYGAAIEARAMTSPDDAWKAIQSPKVKAQLGADYDKTFKSVEAAVNKAYVSRADAMAVDNPSGVEAFVRANEAKFGHDYGSALERAHAAADNGAGKAAAAQTKGFVFDPTSAPKGAVGRNIKTGEYLFGATTNRDGSPTPGPATAAGVKADNAEGAATIAARTVSFTGDQLYPAFHGQESGGGKNITTSIDDAHGDMQIIPATFKAFAKPGEDINNRADNIAVGKRILNYYSQKYNGDAARVAVAYFSGEGNVSEPGSPTPWKSDRHDGQGTYVSQYVNGILGRLGHPGINAPAPGPLGHGSMTADGGLARPGFDGADPGAAAEPPTPGPAAFMPPPPPAPSQTPEQAQTAIFDDAARRLREIDGMGISQNAKDVAYRQVEVEKNIALAQAGVQAAAVKAREEAASDDVLGDARKNGFQSAYKKLNAYMDDPAQPISEKHFETLNDVLERRYGNPNPINFGPKYAETLNNIVQPKDEAQRVSDPREIMRMEANGEITEKGAGHLMHALEVMKKSTSEFGMQQRIAGVMNYAKDYLDKSVNEPFMQIKDPEGKRIFEMDFTNQFYSQMESWRDGGKNMAEFPLLDRKKLDETLAILRPRSKINEFNIQAGAMAPVQPEAPNTPLPPAPENLNPAAWGTLMQKPPTVGGVPIHHDMWGKVLTALASDPRPAVIASFDRYFGPGGFDGAKLAASLNAQRERGNREEMSPAESDAMTIRQHERAIDEWLHSMPAAASRLLLGDQPITGATETDAQARLATLKDRLKMGAR